MFFSSWAWAIGCGLRQNAPQRRLLLVEKLAAQWRAGWSTERKFQSRVSRAERGGITVLLAEPQTFMNASGEAVGALMRFYQLPPERILVVVDDADLPLGEIRLRPVAVPAGITGWNR